MTVRRLVVVGAGITGLAAAFEWRRRRPDDEVVVLEAGNRIGGKLHRVQLAGHWYDTGPEAVLARVPEAVQLVERLGLADRLVAPATTQAAVVLPDGSGRVALGGVAHKPWRNKAADDSLPQGAQAVYDALFAEAHPTAENEFKLTLAKRTLASVLSEARAQA